MDSQVSSQKRIRPLGFWIKSLFSPAYNHSLFEKQLLPYHLVLVEIEYLLMCHQLTIIH